MSLNRFFNKFVFISVSFIPTMDICPFCCESNKNSVIEITDSNSNDIANFILDNCCKDKAVDQIKVHKFVDRLVRIYSKLKEKCISKDLSKAILDVYKEIPQTDRSSDENFIDGVFVLVSCNGAFLSNSEDNLIKKYQQLKSCKLDKVGLERETNIDNKSIESRILILSKRDNSSIDVEEGNILDNYGIKCCFYKCVKG